MEENQELSTTEEIVDTESSPSEEITDEEIFNALDEDNEQEGQTNDTADNQDGQDVEDTTQQEDDKQIANKKEEEKDNNSKANCPEKFLKQDGTPDVEKILSSYKELEQYNTQKVQELNKELEELRNKAQAQEQQQAQNMGYQTPQDMQFALNVANHVAQGYMNNIDKCYDPEYVRGLLYSYAQRPSLETLNEIEEQFDINVVKDVNSNSTLYAYQLQQQYEQQAYEQRNIQLKEEATNYVQNAVSSYPEWFEIKEFVDFFGDALKTKGDTFEAGEFIKHIQNLKTYFRNELLNELKQKNSNNSAIEELISQTPTGGAKTSQKEVTMNSSDADITAEISRLI